MYPVNKCILLTRHPFFPQYSGYALALREVIFVALIPLCLESKYERLMNHLTTMKY